MKNVVARQIELNSKGSLVVDGLALPWFIGPEIDLEDVSGRNSLFGLTVTIYADRVIVHSAGGTRDTLMEAARAESTAIVREGLKDVIEWCERA